jgi:hypothetical protein
MLEYTKYLTYNKILTTRANYEAEARNYKESITEAMGKIETMKNDIENNSDAIEFIEDEQFYLIVSNYAK